MSLEVLGDGGDDEDLCAVAAALGWVLAAAGDGWVSELEPGRKLTDQEMWELVWDKREGDAQDYAEWEAREGRD